MELILVFIPVIIPALGFLSGLMLGQRKPTAGIAGAVIFGLLGGAYIGSAASSMSAVSGNYPMLRGAAAGAAAGLAIGMLIAAILELLRRRRARR